MLLELRNIGHNRREMLDNKELTSQPACRTISSRALKSAKLLLLAKS